MKKNALGVLVIGLLTFAVAAQKGDRVKDKLQGVWVVVSLDSAGKNVPEELLTGQTLTFKGDTIIYNKKFNENGEKEVATYKIDVSKKPAQIDMTPTGGPEKDKTTKMIFLLNGDTLKIAGKIGSEKRPADFEGADLSIMMLKRQMK
jgi:uncharacterized protein (TIGR03067 family)